MERGDPVRIEIPDADLADLRERLLRTRWPDAETWTTWSQVSRWPTCVSCAITGLSGTNWRPSEARLNALPQCRIEIDGWASTSCTRARRTRARCRWCSPTAGRLDRRVPEVIGPLTDPAAYGGDRRTPSTWCPSLPGYGFSDKPDRTGWGVQRIAAAWAELMARLATPVRGAGRRLGHQRHHQPWPAGPEHLVGIHLNPPIAAPDPDTFGDLTDASGRRWPP